MNDNDNIILFPTNRIKNKKTVEHPVDPKQHQKLVEEQTKFVNMGIRTNQMTFTADLAVVIDTIRGPIYRDFSKPHPAQQLADKMVTIQSKNGKKTARLNYNEVLPTKHKTHKPLSPDIEDEVRDLSDMADIHFTPDFDPENKWI